MYPHALIDLHCDTLTALRPEDAPCWTPSATRPGGGMPSPP